MFCPPCGISEPPTKAVPPATLTALLEQAGFGAVHEPTGEAALDRLEALPVDLVITDLRMPGMDGAELLRRIQQHYPHVIRVILSGQSDKEMVLQSIGATHLFLSKPCEKEVLQATIERACALRMTSANGSKPSGKLAERGSDDLAWSALA